LHRPVPVAQSLTYAQTRHAISCLLPSRSDSALLTTDRLQGQSAWRAKGANIPHRWLAEQAAILAIQLGGALVSDLKCRTGGVQTIDDSWSFFLILKTAPYYTSLACSRYCEAIFIQSTSNRLLTPGDRPSPIWLVVRAQWVGHALCATATPTFRIERVDTEVSFPVGCCRC